MNQELGIMGSGERAVINSIIHDSLFLILRRDRRGSTLLLALIILGGLVATSFTVGTAVVTRLRNTKAVDSLVLASYAAESGVEDLLYAVRRGERCDVNGALGVIRNGACVPLGVNGVLENGATWERSIAAASRELFVTVEEQGVEQLDLLPVSGAISSGSSVGIRTLLFTAQSPTDDAWLEVSWVPWLDSGAPPAVGRVLFSPEELLSRKTVDLQAVPTGGTPIAYRIRFRGVSGRPGTLRVRAARDGDGKEEVEFPSRIRATVVGEMDSARYATRVEFLPWLPVVPVFDYVLFSECDIVKGGTINCP